MTSGKPVIGLVLIQRVLAAFAARPFRRIGFQPAKELRRAGRVLEGDRAIGLKLIEVGQHEVEACGRNKPLPPADNDSVNCQRLPAPCKAADDSL